MRISKIVAALLIAGLAGCATTKYEVGRDFSSDKVPDIQKGETTASDLRKMFGEPYSKSVVSTDEEKWIYHYINSTASAQSYVVTTTVKTTGTQKTLEVLLKDGVVLNYTHTEGELPNSSSQTY